jgi:hypothetical protein
MIGRMAPSGKSKKLDSDRRLSEFWLQEALELSLYERFCRSNETGAERALILHAKGHGSLPDFALLDANRKLILVELKRGRLTMTAANEALDQVNRYAREYPKEWNLGQLAVWYCRHCVAVNVWFEYRGEHSLQSKPDAESRYGRLFEWSSKNGQHYLEGTKNPDRAFEILCDDYSTIVGKTLDGLGMDDRLNVSRCIVLAEHWPDELLMPERIEGISLELWTTRHPRSGPHASASNEFANLNSVRAPTEAVAGDPRTLEARPR